MVGKALIWFQDLEESGMLMNWNAFVKALLLRFGSSCYDDPMKALTKAKFEVLSNRLRGLLENYKLSYFLSGLKDEIRLPTRNFSPMNLLSTYDLAKI